MSRIDVAVIGGGFSGCAIAANIARGGDTSTSLALFEPAELGRGAAYGTSHPEHLLNTRAHQMSLYSGDPDHFVRWLGARAGRMDFVSRRLYGEYVAEVARHALELSRFMHVPDRVASVRRAGDQFTVETSCGIQFDARTVAIATGNALPNDEFLPLEARLHPGYVADPWRFDYRVVGGHVLVVGSGLSALDVLVALRGCGHRGTVHVLSRHGRFPEVHADVAPYDVVPALDASSALAVLRSFRRHVEDAARRGFDWRAVVDAVRPEGEAIWRRLPENERLRFERHLRSLWERRRHRAPQEVDAARHEYERSGRLFTHAGRITQMERGTATIELCSGAALQLRPDWIVNCVGLGRISGLARNPLLRGLFTDGSISADSRRVGLRVHSSLAAMDAAGNPVAGLFIVGSAVRGSRFEATAVPELRVVAEQAAAEILATLNLERFQERLEAYT
jgi:uncharacterized NAD(P)/FAD-binding protein YdhS